MIHSLLFNLPLNKMNIQWPSIESGVLVDIHINDNNG